MSFLSKNIDSLLLMDWPSIILLAVICAIAAFFIKDYLANPLFVIFMYPVLLFFSIMAQHVIIQSELYPPKKLDQWLMWTIIASICGTIVGTGLVAGVAVLRDRASDRRA
jgi:hypothetical protein